MEEPKLCMVFLISAYLYTIIWITLFHLHLSSTFRPSFLLLEYFSSSTSQADEAADVLQPISSMYELYPTMADPDVAVLDQENFTRFVRNNRHVAVNFYAPWCFWSRLFAAEYAAAATALKGSAVLAKVDAIANPDLARSYNVRHYPTLHFFLLGRNASSYCRSNKSRDDIVSWVNEQMMYKEEAEKDSPVTITV